MHTSNTGPRRTSYCTPTHTHDQGQQRRSGGGEGSGSNGNGENGGGEGGGGEGGGGEDGGGEGGGTRAAAAGGRDMGEQTCEPQRA